MRNVVIAPTHGYYRDPAQVQINDTIKNSDDAIIIKENLRKEIPKWVYDKAGNPVPKRYHDMKAIHILNKKNDDRIREDFESDLKYSHINGVAFPDVGDSANLKHWRGPV